LLRTFIEHCLYDICSYAYKKTKKPTFIYQQEV